MENVMNDKGTRAVICAETVPSLPPSLQVSPNIAWEDQTIEQLEGERAYWDAMIQTSTGFASANAAANFRDACEAWIARRKGERS